MKRFYVIVDLEGVAGVARWNQTGIDTPGYAQAVRLCSQELTACVDGIHDASPDAEIWVWDGHGCGSLDIDQFPVGAQLLNNGPIRPPYYMDLEPIDGLFFLGQHAMAGTPHANLAHTYSSKSVERYALNGIDMGEFGCRAALAGSLDIPTLFVSGDDAVCREARALVPDIVCAQVKRGLSLQLALHRSPQKARAIIRTAAARAAEQSSQIPPFVLKGPPYTQDVTIWARTDPVTYLSQGFTQTGPRTFTKTAPRLSDLKV